MTSKIFKFKVKDFDFEKTFKQGLFYFFYQKEPKRKIFWEKELIDLSFWQKGETLFMKAQGKLKNEKKLLQRIEYCFGLKEDMTRFYKLCQKDKFLKKILSWIKNTRIISAFSNFEAIVGAIVSQRNSYKNYRLQMEKIYQKTFFIKERFKKKTLSPLKLGYKLKYLLSLKEKFKEDMKEDELLSLPGIGKYSLELFLVFQKRDWKRFYVDCLTEKIMRECYGIKKDFEKSAKKLWGNFRGLVLLYLQRFFEKK